MVDRLGLLINARTVMIFCLVIAFLTACAGAPTGQPASSAATSKPASSASAPSTQSQPAPSSGQAAKTVKIGAVSPLSGPAAFMGASAKKGYDLAVEQVNSSGGIRSMGGAKLELLHEDHQMKPDVAMGLVERLGQNEKVSAMFGAAVSAVTIASTQAAEKLKIPHLVPMSAADEITGRGYKYTFRVSTNNTQTGETTLQQLKWLASKGMKVQRVALLYEDSALGQGAAEMQKKYVTKDQGFDMVADLSYSAQAKDVTAVVSRLKAAAPDIILATSYVADAILLRKTMDQMGLKPLILAAESGNGHPDYLKAVGSLAEGELISTMSSVDLPLPGVPAYLKAYQGKYGQLPDNQATFHYQSVLILKEALEKAGSDDREAIRKALTEISIEPGSNLVIPTDKFRFDSTGQGSAFLIMLQIQNGVPVTVWPEKLKAKDIILPK